MFGFFKEKKEIQRVINSKYQVIFYAENAYYFQYFRQLFQSLQEKAVRICYISSDENDPMLKTAYHSVDSVYSKATLAFLFQNLQADVMILTMPDLGNFIFKRSPKIKKYIYIFHAMVSTHQQYRSHAFDHYDTIFCAGPHHVSEIKEAEALYALPAKELVPYGYPLLDEMTEKQTTVCTNEKRVLIAPSWYKEGILQTCIHSALEALAPFKFEVVIRPHPEFVKRNKKSLLKIQQFIQDFPNISFDLNSNVWESLLSSNHLITDRSGIAFEFAFVKRKPVVFIDTPLKIQNSDVAKFRAQPVENKFRGQIGIGIHPNETNRLTDIIGDAAEKEPAYADRIQAVKKEMLFNDSMLNGVDYIFTHIS